MGATIPHGKYSGYGHHGCRCDACKDALFRYQKRRDYMILTGQWNPHVATEVVREHLFALRARGLSDHRIASLSGRSVSTVYAVMYRNGPVMSRKVGESFLAVTHDPDPPAGTRVLAAGTIRRARALSALGWTSGEIAAASGLTSAVVRSYLMGRPRRVLSESAAGMHRAYRELGKGFAPDSRTARQNRGEARAKGWATPAGWEDHWLDLSEDELDAELAREVARMGAAELQRNYRSVRERGEVSPLVLAAAKEHNRLRTVRELMGAAA